MRDHFLQKRGIRMGELPGMRVALVHNSSAGSKDHTASALTAAIHEAGHQVILVARSATELLSALRDVSPDLVAIAGGDGTVGTVACALAGSPVPLAIIPLGTANNTALALGVRGQVTDIVRTWKHGRRCNFDIGMAVVGADVRRFGEAAGWGVFPALIGESKREARVRTLPGERERFRLLADRSQPRHYAIDVDGEDRSGEYVLVEVMNLQFVGPQLRLSPTSSPEDGQLELILVSENERGALVELTKAELGVRAPVLPSYRARNITVRPSESRYHVDGKLVDQPMIDGHSSEVRFTVWPEAVKYLVS